MIRRALLTLSLGISLSGCFFSLDGSLVEKKREAGPREVSADRSGKDGGAASEARTADLAGASDSSSPKSEQKPGG